VVWASVVVAGRSTGDRVTSRADAAGAHTAAMLTRLSFGTGGGGKGGGVSAEAQGGGVSAEAQGVGHWSPGLLDALMTEVL